MSRVVLPLKKRIVAFQFEEPAEMILRALWDFCDAEAKNQVRFDTIRFRRQWRSYEVGTGFYVSNEITETPI